ncbi:MAG: VOC family protein [Dehalococcoidales bacterium]|nr:VOC family protein [Dehalococcoidales bacterium]
MVKKSPFENIDHVALVVKDLDKAIEHFESLGMGPFKSPYEARNVVPKEQRDGGKPIKQRSKIAIGKMGSIMLQLIQPLDENAGSKKFLDATGGGFHHVAFSVEDIEGQEAVMEDKGLQEIHKTVFKDGDGGCVYFQGLDKGVIIELVQWPRRLSELTEKPVGSR